MLKFRAGWDLLVIGISLVTVMSCGCGLWNRDAIVFHAINYPIPGKTSELIIPETIMVYRFLMDPAVDTHNLIISDQYSKTKNISNYAWPRDPSTMLTELVTRDLETSGLFQKAVDQTSNVPYRYALEGTIKKFQGVVNGSKGSGLIEMEISLIDFEPRIAGKNKLMKKDYVLEVRSEDTSAKSLVQALDKGTRDLSQQLRNDIRKAITGSL
ncbi:MAG: ABC-type transport auxiliary lipoprotein family protein [Desulfomonilaceae bacterium]